LFFNRNEKERKGGEGGVRGKSEKGKQGAFFGETMYVDQHAYGSVC
jgi:hypothetical protein